MTLKRARSTDKTGETTQRADARRNRSRVLEVAAEAFAADGLAVAMDEIARRAGVGVGTIYRHFPTKEELFTAIVRDRLERLADDARVLADARDPGEAFFGLVDRMIAHGVQKKDLFDALAGSGVDLRAATAGPKTDLLDALGRLLRRAQKSGAVRQGIRAEEVIALLSATFAAAQRTGTSPQRLVAIVRDGLRPPTRAP